MQQSRRSQFLRLFSCPETAVWQEKGAFLGIGGKKRGQ
jgi:hypothetical protein